MKEADTTADIEEGNKHDSSSNLFASKTK